MRIGKLFVIEWSSVSYGFAIHKWRYFDQSSWRHGSVCLGKLKIIW